MSRRSVFERFLRDVTVCEEDLGEPITTRSQRHDHDYHERVRLKNHAEANITPTEMLYGWGKGVMEESRGTVSEARYPDLAKAKRGLAPVSTYPSCDWCAKSTGERLVFGRWWMHRSCWLRAQRGAPSTTKLPTFTNWIT